MFRLSKKQASFQQNFDRPNKSVRCNKTTLSNPNQIDNPINFLNIKKSKQNFLFRLTRVRIAGVRSIVLKCSTLGRNTNYKFFIVYFQSEQIFRIAGVRSIVLKCSTLGRNTNYKFFIVYFQSEQIFRIKDQKFCKSKSKSKKICFFLIREVGLLTYFQIKFRMENKPTKFSYFVGTLHHKYLKVGCQPDQYDNFFTNELRQYGVFRLKNMLNS
eukprot:TRINITY_DN1699_c0_g3_i1.p1 TRINITY_DN1699_c0_g3~~TRINITY_DN1699_c0_g3_i1.p1  ORF type:complete len:214 (-),score=-4.85 TRINITY_DN1699_c0_g3_i1:480-1121(-)